MKSYTPFSNHSWVISR